ncbi:MAG: hypothetical protein ACOCV1_01520 [Bacillota bacterium]
MQKQQKFEVSIPQNFQAYYEKFNKLIKADKQFQRMIKEKESKDGRYKKGRQHSSKVRYAIIYYVNKRIKELKKEEEDNVS